MAEQTAERSRAPRRREAAPEAPKEFEEVVINIDRVARVVKGGRRFRFKALVVVGNKKDKVGVGVSKGADVQAAIAKATDVAKKNMITIPVLNNTIPHDAEVKLSGARVLIKPAAPGTGVIAGGAMRAVCEVMGIKDVIAKCIGSRSAVNVVRATIDALMQMATPENIANKRGLTVKEILGTAHGDKE